MDFKNFGYLTANETAERLGVTPGRVRAMIQAGRLKASKFGTNYMIHESDLKRVLHRKVGRPPHKKNRKRAA